MASARLERNYYSETSDEDEDDEIKESSKTDKRLNQDPEEFPPFESIPVDESFPPNFQQQTSPKSVSHERDGKN